MDRPDYRFRPPIVIFRLCHDEIICVFRLVSRIRSSRLPTHAQLNGSVHINLVILFDRLATVGPTVTSRQIPVAPWRL
jgi:hypothetical protein